MNISLAQYRNIRESFQRSPLRWRRHAFTRLHYAPQIFARCFTNVTPARHVTWFERGKMFSAMLAWRDLSSGARYCRRGASLLPSAPRDASSQALRMPLSHTPAIRPLSGDTARRQDRPGCHARFRQRHCHACHTSRSLKIFSLCSSVIRRRCRHVAEAAHYVFRQPFGLTRHAPRRESCLPVPATWRWRHVREGATCDARAAR